MTVRLVTDTIDRTLADVLYYLRVEADRPEDRALDLIARVEDAIAARHRESNQLP